MLATHAPFHQIDLQAFRRTDEKGDALPGPSGLFIADELAPHGYQIIRSVLARDIRPGDMIPVGSQEEMVPLSDPRPDLMPEADDERERKLVRKNYRKVLFVGRPFVMILNRLGLRTHVCRVYFERNPDPQFPF